MHIKIDFYAQLKLEPAKSSGDRDTNSGRHFIGAPERLNMPIILDVMNAISFVCARMPDADSD